MVFGIFHHILHTLHLRAQLYYRLRGVNNGVNRLQKRAHKALECHQHTYGQLALNNKVSTQHQHRHIHQSVGQYG